MIASNGGPWRGEATYRHAEKSRGIVLQSEVFVCEFPGAVNGGTAGSIAVDEITALDHEIFDLFCPVSWMREHEKRSGERATRWNLLPLYP